MNRRWVGLTAAALLLMGTIWVVGWVRWLSRPPTVEHEPVQVVVERGTSVRALGQLLKEAGVIRSSALFEIYLRARRETDRIQAGTYELPRNRPLGDIVEILLSGRTVLIPVTIPEGLRLEQTAGHAARGLGVDSLTFLTLISDSTFTRSLGLSTPTLEGYLFPETYRVDPKTTEKELVQIMVNQFWDTFTPAWRARADSLGRTVHEIVTLASIVEEEARVPEERTTIAGVFWNRLDIGMRLEADPTIQYALGGHRQRVLYRDLEVDSPYNTYRYAGLPPGPIASPGKQSLEATLYPDSVPYLFFVATGEGGRHTFSETLAEHNRKRREINP